MSSRPFVRAVALLAIPAALALLVQGCSPPAEQVGALLAVQPPSVAPGVLVPERYAAAIDRHLATIAHTATSRAIMDLAIEESSDLQKTEWYMKDPATAAVRLRKEITVRPVPDTNLLRVSMTGRDKKELAIIVNAVAKAIVKQRNRLATRQVDADIKRLEAERERVLKLLVEKRQEAAGSKDVDAPEPGKIAELDARIAGNMERLRTVILGTARLSLMLEQARIDLRAIEGLPDEEVAKLPEVRMALQETPILRALWNNRIALEAEREALKEKYTPEHNAVKDYERSIQAIDNKIKEITTEATAAQVALLRKQRAMTLESITTQLLSVTTAKQKMQTDITDHVRQREALRVKVEARLKARDEAERDAFALAEEKDRIERRLGELRLERQALQVLYIERPATPE